MKKVVRLILFVAVILLINTGLNFIFISAAEAHRLQNYELYSNKGEYELIAFGPSDCMEHFDSPVASELLGIKCFNYGQLGTSYKAGSVEASFENAMTVQSPKIVLFFVPHENLYKDYENEESAKTFIHSTAGMTNKLAMLKYYIKSSDETGALEKIFQWKYVMGDEVMPTVSEMKKNIQDKMSKEYRICDIDWRNSIKKSSIYVKDGFVAQPSEHNLQTFEEYKVELKKTDIPKDVNGYDLDDMIKRCKKKGITPVILMGTLSIEMICEDDNYDAKTKNLKAIADKNDVAYFDFNMIKKEYFRPELSEWADSMHLDINGARKYTQILCEVLQAHLSGEDTSDYFYPTFAEMLESYDNVEIVR